MPSYNKVFRFFPLFHLCCHIKKEQKQSWRGHHHDEQTTPFFPVAFVLFKMNPSGSILRGSVFQRNTTSTPFPQEVGFLEVLWSTRQKLCVPSKSPSKPEGDFCVISVFLLTTLFFLFCCLCFVRKLTIVFLMNFFVVFFLILFRVIMFIKKTKAKQTSGCWLGTHPSSDMASIRAHLVPIPPSNMAKLFGLSFSLQPFSGRWIYRCESVDDVSQLRGFTNDFDVFGRKNNF